MASFEEVVAELDRVVSKSDEVDAALAQAGRLAVLARDVANGPTRDRMILE
ncbi:hypothetical protein ACWGE0_45215 [Lentzea sp. NPDC054927]